MNTSVGEAKYAKHRRFIIRAILILLAILLIFFELRRHAPTLLDLLEHGNLQEVEEYIRGAGSRSVLILILLQTIETIAIVIPSLPVYLCAGIIFGTVQGSIICYLTNWVLCVIMFTLSKQMNYITSNDKNSEESIIQDLLQKTTHPIRAIFFLCLLPIVPGGMIPILAAHTKLTLKEFIKGFSFGSLAIVVYVACGDLIMRNNYKASFWLLGIICIIFILIMIFRKKLIDMLK